MRLIGQLIQNHEFFFEELTPPPITVSSAVRGPLRAQQASRAGPPPASRDLQGRLTVKSPKAQQLLAKVPSPDRIRAIFRNPSEGADPAVVGAAEGARGKRPSSGSSSTLSDASVGAADSQPGLMQRYQEMLAEPPSSALRRFRERASQGQRLRPTPAAESLVRMSGAGSLEVRSQGRERHAAAVLPQSSRATRDSGLSAASLAPDHRAPTFVRVARGQGDLSRGKQLGDPSAATTAAQPKRASFSQAQQLPAQGLSRPVHCRALRRHCRWGARGCNHRASSAWRTPCLVRSTSRRLRYTADVLPSLCIKDPWSEDGFE